MQELIGESYELKESDKNEDKCIKRVHEIKEVDKKFMFLFKVNPCLKALYKIISLFR